MDPLHLVGLMAVLAVTAVWLAHRKPRADLPPTRRGAAPTARPVVSRTRSVDPVGPLQTVPGVPNGVQPEPEPAPPASLLDLQWQAAESLPESRRDQVVARLMKSPPPPRAFYQLVSPDFVAEASSAELAELVMSVPLAATKVLSRVNSAFYGLQQPVGNVGQAITFLGLNSVRSLCLQYMMESAFKAPTPALRQHFDHLWAASAVAGEVSQKLAQRLQLADVGGLVTEVALSSLGHFAAATLMPDAGPATSAQSLLARTWTVQAQLGAPAAEIGTLLMRAWDLPETLVEDVRAIDRMLVTTARPDDPHRYLRRAVAYLSSRLGERLAQGEDVDFSRFDEGVAAGDDYFHLRAGLGASQRQRLMDALKAPDLVRSLQGMLASLRAPIMR